jgi:hypothetical protein
MASNAVDHDLSTSWRSPFVMEAWLQVDLGQRRILDSLVLAATWRTRSAAKAPSLLETSLDAVRWTPLFTMSTEPSSAPVPYRAWFPAREARYVRFSASDWLGGEALVSTFELYGPDCRFEPAPSRDSGDSERSPPR